MAIQEDPRTADAVDEAAVEAVLGDELETMAAEATAVIEEEIGERPPSTGDRLPGTGDRLPGTGDRLRSTGDRSASTGEHPASPDERLPSFSEQIAEQLGGWRGLVESSIPVAVFVLVNIVASLNAALIGSAGVAVAIAVWRLSRRQPIRHAVNGLVGIGIGAIIAWRTGEEKDFYLPGILYGLAYGAALLASVALRMPLVGWIWSVVWVAKVGVQAGLYLADQATALGVARLLLGYPPYALLLAITVWTVRRVNRDAPPPANPA